MHARLALGRQRAATAHARLAGGACAPWRQPESNSKPPRRMCGTAAAPVSRQDACAGRTGVVASRLGACASRRRLQRPLGAAVGRQPASKVHARHDGCASELPRSMRGLPLGASEPPWLMRGSPAAPAPSGGRRGEAASRQGACATRRWRLEPPRCMRSLPGESVSRNGSIAARRLRRRPLAAAGEQQQAATVHVQDSGGSSEPPRCMRDSRGGGSEPPWRMRGTPAAAGPPGVRRGATASL